MVFRKELTYSEFEKKLDGKYIATSCTGYILPHGIYEIDDIYLLLKSLLPHDLKVDITIDDIRLRSNSTNNKTIRFTKNLFLNIILGFT